MQASESSGSSTSCEDLQSSRYRHGCAYDWRSESLVNPSLAHRLSQSAERAALTQRNEQNNRK